MCSVEKTGEAAAAPADTAAAPAATAATAAAPKMVNSGFHYREVKGDLFSCDSRSSIAHCVSVDLHMGKGIAVLFKNKFGQVDQLRKQGETFIMSMYDVYV